MREMCKFALSGTLYHSVFGNEGVYTMKMKPRAVQLLGNIPSNEVRGCVVAILEAVFKATQHFREKDFWTYSKNVLGHTFVPKDFLNYTNNFNLKDCLSGTNVCGKIQCNGVPFFNYYCRDKDCMYQVALDEFLKMEKQEVYTIGKNGYDIKKISPDIVRKHLNEIAALFGNTKFFECTFTPHPKLPSCKITRC
jgi:hypothetical protein